MTSYYLEFQNYRDWGKQPESIAKAISGLDLKLHNYGSFTFVDIGSNDGSLTHRVRELLLNHDSNVKTYACEPGQEPYVRLRVRFSGLPDVQTDNLDLKSWFAKYEQELKGRVNLVLNSHTFYHFPRSYWHSIFNQSNALLSQSGQHVIVIDSEQQVIGKLIVPLEERGLRRGIGGYGSFLLGSDLENFFESEGITYEHRLIDQPIALPKNSGSLQNFVRVLGFALTYSPNDILRLAKDDVVKFMSEYEAKEEYVFPRFQDMFILRESPAVSGNVDFS